MNNTERSKILSEIVELTEIYPEKHDDEIMLMEYADEVHLSRNSARARLDKLVEKGILETHLARHNNKTVRVYRKAGK